MPIVWQREFLKRFRCGRSKLRLKDSVVEEYHKLGISVVWRTAAVDRPFWRNFVFQTRDILSYFESSLKLNFLSLTVFW